MAYRRSAHATPQPPTLFRPHCSVAFRCVVSVRRDGQPQDVMRSSIDLLDLLFVFSQQPLLTAAKFVEQAKLRAVSIDANGLEVLHHQRLLVPLFRVRRDRRLIEQLVRSGDAVTAHQVAHWEGADAPGLRDARDARRLYDPASERWTRPSQRQRSIGSFTFEASTYLYSPYQLLLLPPLAPALSHATHSSDGRPRLDVSRFWLDFARHSSRQLAPLVVALSALEPRYFPMVMRTLSIRDFEYADYRRWEQTQRLTATLRWLNVDARWLRESAATLLQRADQIDPLGDWLQVVREAAPASWERLRGTARSAIDLRIAAELLLRYYEHLARGRRAAPLPTERGRWRGEFDSRLKPSGELDVVLTERGLSPQPSVLLVVEGATEVAMLTHLFTHFSIRNDESFITVEDREGIGKDLAALVSYAVAPRTQVDSDARYLQLRRPATQLLVVNDAEGPLRTKAQREAHRTALIERVVRRLDAAHRTPPVRDVIDGLIHLETWAGDGQSFEFAHFTDRQLAVAIAQCDARPRQPDPVRRIELVARCRASEGNLDSLLGGASKLALSEALWPVLERKILRATARGTQDRIPIVRVLYRALDLAHETPRRNYIMAL